jgi:hypothetical protein
MDFTRKRPNKRPNKIHSKGGGRCCLCDKPGRGRWGTKCYDGNPEDCCKNTRKYKERNRERNRKNKTWFNKLMSIIKK